MWQVYNLTMDVVSSRICFFLFIKRDVRHLSVCKYLAKHRKHTQVKMVKETKNNVITDYLHRLKTYITL